ncbi:MAG: shikimate kinase [Bacillota bacterium]|nr:shikimate kinase [Bacillota bacterium]
MNIVLIGMPGAGKSTVGVILAKVLGISFLDTDIVIQQDEKSKLHKIIERFGIKYFLEVEERHILGLEVEDHVIATGGSVIYSEKSIEHLKESGILVYLQLSLKEVEKRLSDITTRGIAMEKGSNLEQLYSERKPLYEKYADITIDCTGKSMEEVVGEIVGAL